MVSKIQMLLFGILHQLISEFKKLVVLLMQLLKEIQ